MNNFSDTCYKKVRDETKLIQDKIVNELGLNPVDEEIVVLYDGEKGNEVNFLFHLLFNQFPTKLISKFIISIVTRILER